MQIQPLFRGNVCHRKSCGLRPPVVQNRLQIHTARYASGRDAAPEQATSTETAADPLPVAETASPVVEPTVLEPGSASETSASGVTPEPGDGAAVVDFAEPPLSLNKAAQLQYGILGAVFAAAAGLTAAAAFRMPEALLSPAAAADPWAATLLGVLAATYLRSSGVFFHMSNAAKNAELLCMRHQRLAAGTAVCGVLAVLSQAAGVASAQLVGLQLVLAAASAAVVYSLGRNVWSVHPFISTVLEEGRYTFPGTLAALIRSSLNWFSTVAGTLLAVVMVMSVVGFASLVLAPAPALPLPLGSWPGQPAVLDAASAGLRRLAGVGLLLLGVQAHGLMDMAVQARRPADLGTESGIKQFLTEHMVRTKDPYAKYILPNPWTYRYLHLSFVLAAALQTFLLLRAPGLGVNVNTDGALWGPLYGTAAASLLYGLSAMTLFDWSSLGDAVLRFTAWSTSLVLHFFNAFVWKFQWAERVSRT